MRTDRASSENSSRASYERFRDTFGKFLGQGHDVARESPAGAGSRYGFRINPRIFRSHKITFFNNANCLMSIETFNQSQSKSLRIKRVSTIFTRIGLYKSRCENCENFFLSKKCSAKKKSNNVLIGSSFVKQALEGEYPKFLRVFLDLRKRLKERPEAIGTYTVG